MKPLVVVGASGFGREVACLVEDINKINPQYNLLGLVDDALTENTVEGFSILGDINYLYSINPKPFISIAIAHPNTRKKLVERLKNDFEFVTLVHPTVSMSPYVIIGEGSIICRNTLFTTNISIGNQCIINVNCSVGHDTQIGDFTSIMSHTAIAGDVFIGSGCYFGLHCTVINKISIGASGTYGAGTVIVNDMPENIVAVGVPARVIKSLKSEE